jgi:CRP/FNR family transcriptional regulator
MCLKKYIDQVQIFSPLSDVEKRALRHLAVPITFQKGEWITHYGDIWPYLFIIEKGTVSAIKESFEGRSLIVGRFEAGEVFWGLAFFLENEPMPAALVANEKCKLQIWSRDQLLPIILANGNVSWEMTLMMVKRMLITSDIVEGLAFQPVAHRLAKFLVTQFGEQSTDKFNRDLTLDEMAAHIGTTREVVCRVLHKFSDQGLIHITRTEFEFTNRNGLRRLAQAGSE